MGYIALPRDPRDVRFEEALWGEADYASADEAAREVILAVRAGRFADAGPNPPEDGPVAALCGIGFIGATAGGAGDGEGEAGEAGAAGGGA